MNPTDIEEMNIEEINGFDYIQINNSYSHISKKLSLKKLINFITKDMKSFKLIDVNQENKTFLFEDNNGEKFDCTFEFIEDLNKFITGELKFKKSLEKKKCNCHEYQCCDDGEVQE